MTPNYTMQRVNKGKMVGSREQILLERELLRQEYGNLFDEVSAILFESDPIGINFETNTDEYEPEVSTILPRLKSCHSIEEACSVIYQEFTYWFGREDAGPETRYQKIAESVWAAWQRHQQCEHKPGTDEAEKSGV